MPTVISCPECDRKLRVPEDLLGKKVKCPGCKLSFTAAVSRDDEDDEDDAPPPPPPPKARKTSEKVVARPPVREEEDDEDDAPAPRKAFEDLDEPKGKRAPVDEDDDLDDAPSRKRGKVVSFETDQERWQKVHDGFGFILKGIWILIGANLLLPVLLGLSFAIGGLASKATTTTVTTTQSGVKNLPGGFPADPGFAAPPSSGGILVGLLAGGGLSGLSMLLFVAAIVAGLIFQLVGFAYCMVVPEGKGNGNFARGLAIASFALVASFVGAPAAGPIVFLFFIWSMAHTIDDKTLSDKVVRFFYAIVYLFIGGIGAMTLCTLVALGSATAAFFLFLLTFVVLSLANLGIFIWYILILYSAKKAVAQVM